MSQHLVNSDHNLLAVLGPTNTGKTHFAIERMLEYKTGIIGLPLRLLAREVYNRIVEKIGPSHVALITGEEKIKPPNTRYWISTVEAMPRDIEVDFIAVDEIQLAADLDRGHVFTDRILNRRGRQETILIGAQTMAACLEKLIPDIKFSTRPRLSELTYAGERKITRLPRRSAIVAFSAEDVYSIAEWIRRYKGGAAVVLGALSPRTRNAQVEMYQAEEVDYIVATDAIGMGLNLDVNHIAFASDRKFDGRQFRRLTPAEFGQIAGRAGRHTRDGTFGTTGRCPPFDDDLIDNLQNHQFDDISLLQWRNTNLDFSSLENLILSLEIAHDHPCLTRAPVAEDAVILELLSHNPDVRRQAKTQADLQRLWDVCQIPDYGKLSLNAHADLVLSLFHFIVRNGRIPDEWFKNQLNAFDRSDGDIDTLSARLAQVRTWNFIANRQDWLRDPEYWQGLTRKVEDNLSDALHERLRQRFVDRRTSVLMRRLRENTMLEAEITSAGDVIVEGQHIGQLQGFRFSPDPNAQGEAAKALLTTAAKALASEIDRRANRIHEAVDDAFVLAHDGSIRWLGEIVAKITVGDHILKPNVVILADETLSGASLDQVRTRLELWLTSHIKKLLGALIDLEEGQGLEGLARGIAFQISESLGVCERAKIAHDVKSLDQDSRAKLRKMGVRFGAFHLYLPLLLKPAPRALAAQLWALRHGGIHEVKGLDEVPLLASSGRTSFPTDKDIPKGFYLAAGFRVCAERCVRVDILERLADLIRPAQTYRPGISAGDAPAGTADGDGFVVTVAMTSLTGCSGEAFAAILRSLGYVSEQRIGPAITVPLLPAANTAPASTPENIDTDATTPPAENTEDEHSEAANTAEAVTEVAIDVNSSEEEQTPSAPAMIEVWRPARAHQRHKKPSPHQRAHAEHAPSHEQKTSDTRDHKHKSAHHHHSHKNTHKNNKNSGRAPQTSPPKIRERKPDPSSPFAKLLALKEELENKEKKS
jgi:ATP-dependent RNA helicase SUPV3L1/SUV3